MAQADTRRTIEIAIGHLTLEFNHPTDGQIAALRRIVALAERGEAGDKAAIGKAIEMFLDIADTMVTEDDTLNALYTAFAKEELGMADYADAFLGGLREFLPQEEAPKGTRRPARAGTGRRK